MSAIRGRRTLASLVPWQLAMHRLISTSVAVAALSGGLVELDAQQVGSVTGTVTRDDGVAPVAGVDVRVRDLPVATTTSSNGDFVIRGLPVGPHTLELTALGYEPREVTIDVVADTETTTEIGLVAAPFRLADLVVDAATRTPQPIVEAPAAISVVDRALANDLSITAQTPRALATLTGVEVVQSGVQDFNVNTRGFNSSLTRRMLVLQDGRDLAIALLGFQEWSAISSPLSDLRSIEVVRGPGSALYGANAYSGVIDMRTWSPRDIPGIRATLAGGELSTIRGDVRYAGLSGDGRLGFKANVGYSRSDSWTVARTATDGGSLRREYADATDLPVPDVVESVPLFGQTADATTGIVSGKPDPITIGYGSGRVDYYAPGGSVATAEVGGSLSQNATWVTGIGRIQVDEALRPWGRLQWSSDQWSVSSWYAGRDTRDAPHRSLSSGALIVDESSIYDVEVRTQQSLTDAVDVVAGASTRNTRTNTRQTLFEAADDDRSDWSYSGYAQASVALGGRIDLVGAVRVDGGSLFDTQLSPRLALVFTPSPLHSFRITASRAFQTPTQLERYLRVPAASPANLSALEAGLRASPLGAALDSVPSGALFTTSTSVPVLALGNRDLEVESVRSLEAGYKGQLADGLFVTVDGYYSELSDFVTDLAPGANPTYQPWTAPDEVPDASKAAVEDAVRTQLVAAGQGLAAAGLTRLQDGSTAIVVSYANAGEAKEYGVELGVSLSLSTETSLEANYSYLGFDIESGSTLPGDKLTANAPNHRGSVSASYQGRQGLDLGASLQLAEAFDWAAGVYAGVVPASQIVDLRAGYRLSGDVRIHAVATNAFDQRHFQMYGGSVLRRRIIVGLTVAR